MFSLKQTAELFALTHDALRARALGMKEIPPCGALGRIASHGSTKWLLTIPLFGCVMEVAVGARDIPAQGCTYEISGKIEVSIWLSFSLLAK